MKTCGVVRTYHKPNCNSRWCDCNNKNGTILKKEYFQNNGIIEGIYKSYYVNGQLYEEVNYINGERNGIYKSYRENRQL